MQVFRSWHWSVLAVTFGFTTQAAQAGMITPDSIPNPPSAVDSANGTPVFSNNLVTTQYSAVPGYPFMASTIKYSISLLVLAPLQTLRFGLSMHLGLALFPQFHPYPGSGALRK